MAKDRDERFADCRELIEAAPRRSGSRDAAPVTHRGPRLVHHRRAILAAGLVLLGVAAAAAIVALTGGGENAPTAPVGNCVAAIGPRDDRVASFIQSVDAPSNIAVGEGAVWVLSADNRTISRIDPRTMAVTGTITARGGRPTSRRRLGWLWVGNGAGRPRRQRQRQHRARRPEDGGR